MPNHTKQNRLFNVSTSRGAFAPARERLAFYRATADKAQHSKDWRAWRRHLFAYSVPNNTTGPKGERFTESLEQYGAQLIGYIVPDRRGYWTPEAVSMKNEKYGWYSDHHSQELIRGAVVRLRCSRGTLYIPATDETDADGTVHYLQSAELVEKGANQEQHEKALREASNSAEHFAQRTAEESREYRAKDQAEQDISEAKEAIHELNKKALALLREIRAASSFGPAVCSALRERLEAMLEERAEQFKTIEARAGNYWSAVERFN